MTCVLLHPIGLDRNCWQFLGQPLQRDAVALDLLWHGGRPRPDGPMSLAAMADDVVASVDGPLDLVGVSMGASVALQTAVAWPERIRSLVLVASAGAAANGGAEQRRRADLALSTGMAGMLDETMNRWLSERLLADPNHPVVRYTRERLLADDPASFAASWLALAEPRPHNAIGDVTVPVTVVHARDDKAGSEKARADLAALLPRSRFQVADGPHMIHMERPEVFQAAVLDHLAWVGSETPASSHNGALAASGSSAAHASLAASPEAVNQ